MIFHLTRHEMLGKGSRNFERVSDESFVFHRCQFHSLLKPGVSGLRAGLQILSRSPSSLVCPSIDSSFTGGDSEAHAGLDESVRNDSLPVPPLVADELFPEPKSKPLNFENFYRSSRFSLLLPATFLILT